MSQLWVAQDENTVVIDWPGAPDLSRLYYEAHITVPPLEPRQVSEIDEYCTTNQWRRSTFEMHKDGLVPNAFVSARHKSRTAIIGMVADMIKWLLARGYTVLRWKIEDTLLDSSKGDRLLPRTEHVTVPIPRQGIYPEASPPPAATDPQLMSTPAPHPAPVAKVLSNPAPNEQPYPVAVEPVVPPGATLNEPIPGVEIIGKPNTTQVPRAPATPTGAQPVPGVEQVEPVQQGPQAPPAPLSTPTPVAENDIKTIPDPDGVAAAKPAGPGEYDPVTESFKGKPDLP